MDYVIKEYCVYIHRDMNGKIFYVGMGKKERPFDVYEGRRSKKWDDHVEKYGLGSIDIIAWYDTKEEAIACEEEFTLLLKDFGEPLTNVLMGRKYARPEDAPMFGKEHSEESKKKMSAAQMGEKNHKFNGIWIGVRKRDNAVVAFAGNKDISARGYNQGGISNSARGVYHGDKNNYRGYTWSQTLDKEYLNTLLNQNNFVDEESKSVLINFIG